MAELDLPVEQLRSFTADLEAPHDLDSFWADTLAASRARTSPVRDHGTALSLPGLQVNDLTFAGYGGDPIKAWFAAPPGGRDLPLVVEFIGYGGGRGLPHEYALLPAAGYAHLIVDTRGQGSVWGNGGDTPDPHGSGPSTPGFVTRGIESPETYYYRRVFADAALAVDAGRTLPGVDPDRVAVKGTSQGGGIALAAAALSDHVSTALIDVPFMCHIMRAVRMTDAHPYAEIRRYLAVNRGRVDQTVRTLAYFDGVNLAPRATAASLWSVGLMDEVCPPSTIYAAYHAYGGPRQMVEYPFNGHDAGQMHQVARQLDFLAETL